MESEKSTNYVCLYQISAWDIQKTPLYVNLNIAFLKYLLIGNSSLCGIKIFIHWNKLFVIAAICILLNLVLGRAEMIYWYIHVLIRPAEFTSMYRGCSCLEMKALVNTHLMHFHCNLCHSKVWWCSYVQKHCIVEGIPRQMSCQHLPVLRLNYVKSIVVSMYLHASAHTTNTASVRIRTKNFMVVYRIWIQTKHNIRICVMNVFAFL